MERVVAHFKYITEPMQDPWSDFEQALLSQDNIVEHIYGGLIGADLMIPGRAGLQKLVYADYFASGRALRQIEEFMMEHVLPYYANSHTDSSFCGGYITRLRERSRKSIAANCGADLTDHAVIFAGPEATTGLNRLVHLFGIRQALAEGLTPHVLIGPYEHHSNVLPWRESGAVVTEIPEGESGGPDLEFLKRVLAELSGSGPIIGSFSVASNVTGICTEVVEVTRLMKAAGCKIIWDYAGGAPYLPITMNPETGLHIDAVVLSPHKYVGGPGASGVLIVRRDAVTARVPSAPGDGTVAFVNSAAHDYLSRVEDLEEGGTPNILGDIRAGLSLLVKDAIGQNFIAKRNAELAAVGVNLLGAHPNIKLLAANRADRLPVFSFTVQDLDGNPFDYQLFTRMLSDYYGIQARGGRACVGSYAHKLLNISDDRSNYFRAEISSGKRGVMPGFIRLNLSYLMDDETVGFVLRSVLQLADTASKLGDSEASAAFPPSATLTGQYSSQTE
jgi:selenocysteine lyase/cysteine desulfurase